MVMQVKLLSYDLHKTFVNLRAGTKKLRLTKAFSSLKFMKS